MKSLMRNNVGFSDQLKAGPYRSPAVVPTTPWLDREPPGWDMIEVRSEKGHAIVHFRLGPGEPPFLWAVWTLRGGEWSLRIEPASAGPIDLGPSWDGRIDVSAVDRLGNESQRATFGIVRLTPEAEALLKSP